MSDISVPERPTPAHTRRRRIGRIAREIAIAVALLLGIRSCQQRGLPEGPAPALAGADLHGKPTDLADYRGAPVLLYFWATWCGVCEVEAANVQALSADLPVVGVASQSGDAATVRAHMAQEGLTFRSLNDPTGSLAKRFGVRAFPTLLVVDGAGHIAHAEVGYTTTLGLRARMWLAR